MVKWLLQPETLQLIYQRFQLIWILGIHVTSDQVNLYLLLSCIDFDTFLQILNLFSPSCYIVFTTSSFQMNVEDQEGLCIFF
jgi:hypothetical protein